ncbi:tail assembly chaperone [Shouchella rhizosphaerae]|uniref:tail assembly chaperone n=1 Tax=Shouchella rhizosphaerae TaxID=866786 RepID=UPI003F7F0127
MKFKIGKEEHQLEFGVKFLREMDKTYRTEQNGFEFGVGMEQALVYLSTENPLVLIDIFKAATSHEKNKPSETEISKAIETYSKENDGLSGLFEMVKEELGNSPWTKGKIKKIEKATKK